MALHDSTAMYFLVCGIVSRSPGEMVLQMTKRYAHLNISNLPEAISRISTDTSTDTSATETFAYVQ